MNIKHQSIPMFKNIMTNRFVILGSGGGGRTTASIIEMWYSEQGKSRPEIIFLDDADKRQEVNGYPVMGPISKAKECTDWPEDTGFIVAFGATHMPARERVFLMLRANGRRIINAIHPRATIDRCATIGSGNVIAANCVIHPNAEMGNNCFLCVAVTIDHDDKIGDNNYLSPGVHLSGGVILEDNIFLGTGAVVLPCVHIGKGAIIGAGAVVIRDVAAGATVVGVPARPIEKKKET